MSSSAELVASAVMDASSFDERVEAMGRSAKSLILIWSLRHPLVPQHAFAAPAVSRKKRDFCASKQCAAGNSDGVQTYL